MCKFKSKLFLLALSSACLCGPSRAADNLFVNPSFESFSNPRFGMGQLTDNWVAIQNLPSTFSSTNSFGLPPNFNDWFTGATGHAGAHWVGCRTGPSSGITDPDIFGQVLPNAVKPGLRYRISMWVRQPFGGIFANAARYQMWFLRSSGQKTLLSTLRPTEGFSAGWKYRWAAAVMPTNLGTNSGLIFVPLESNKTNSSCPGVDDMSLMIATTSISGEISMPGTPSNGNGMGLQVMLCDPGTTDPVETINSSIGNSGTFALTSAAPDGNYDLVIRGATTLQARIKDVNIVFGSVSGLSVNLINGDCNGDNFIGTDDYLIVNNSFDKSTGETGFDARADLDQDGYVGTNDYLILNANFDTAGQD